MTANTVQIEILGSVRVLKDDRPVAIGGPKPQLLVARIALSTPRPVSVDELIDVMWRERPPATARKMLHKYVWELRSRVGDEVVVTDGDGYALAADRVHVDAFRFEHLVEAAAAARERGDPQHAWDQLAAALALWRGAPLADLDAGAGLSGEIRRLEAMHAVAVEEQVHVGLQLGRHDLLLPRIQELASQHPFREGIWADLMLALYRCGRHAEALATFSRLRSTLGEELGVDPSPELVDLEQQILQHDPALRLRAPTLAGNLPARLTSFVGRAKELSDLGRLLSVSRLVNLVGPAGSGKTRLAIEVAEDLAAAYPDGVWLVELAPTASPEEVVEAITSSLGVTSQPGQRTRAVLDSYLAGRVLLLVLDNCEHVIDGVAPLAVGLLSAHPGLTVLATSRESLGVVGETIHDVAPLAFPTDDDAQITAFDAVQLFVERVQAVDPQFELNGSTDSAVAQICRRLDGLPLALELAAAKARSIPPEQLSRHLGERFDLLSSPTRTAAPRHQTLRAAIDWSYDSLAPAGRALFRRLSVFRGGFDFEAAQQVCGAAPLAPNHILTVLSDLVDKSLVGIVHRPAVGTRYRLLETLREYGQRRLDRAEADRMRRAHAEYFRTVAERAAPQLRGPRQEPWLRRLESDADNLREALRWSFPHHPTTAVRLAVALADYWDSLGARDEGQEQLRRAVELSDETTPQLAIAARVAASDVFVSTNLSHSIRYASEALAQARRIGDEAGQAKALRALTLAEGVREDHDRAEALGTRALAIFERIGDPWEIALCLERLGQPLYERPERSIGYLEQSLDRYRQAGDRRRQAVVLYKLAARSAQAVGNLDDARAWVERSLAIFDEVGSPQDEAHAHLEYGKILRRQGHNAQAEDVLQDAFSRLRRLGDLRCSVRALTALGITRVERDDHAGATEALRRSIELGRTLDEAQTSRVAVAGMARLLASSGRLQEAATLYGFVDKLGREYAVPVRAAARRKRRRSIHELRAAMGDAGFDRAWRQGQAMDLDAAVALALGAHVA